jgi:Ca2+-binding RTX toxin-like protein
MSNAARAVAACAVRAARATVGKAQGAVAMVERTGGAGNDGLRGTPGRDLLFGLGGNDVLTGRGGRDRLDGGLGDDRLDGGSGNDVLVGSVGRDTILGGAGEDVLTYAGFASGITLPGFTFVSRVFSATIPYAGVEVHGKAIAGVEVLAGSGGNDRIAISVEDGIATLRGGGGRDHLVSLGETRVYGNAGDDIIEASGPPVGLGPARAWGGAGDDIILADRAFGGAGDDTLAATFVDARLTGGAGVDTFVIYSPGPFGGEADHVVTDFRPDAGDRVLFVERPGFFFPFVNFAAMLQNTADTPEGSRDLLARRQPDAGAGGAGRA